MKLRAVVALVLVTGILNGCEDPFTPTVDDLTGTYVAETFTITPAPEGAATVDVLERGGLIRLTLNADRSTTGRLLVPAGALPELSQDFEVSLDGRFLLYKNRGFIWLITDGSDHALNGIELRIEDEGRRLVAHKVGADATTRIVLTRQ